jgi:hypothetical protein
MDLHKLEVPSAGEYARAFRAIETQITPKQRELLEIHYSAPARVISATRLADSVGFKEYRAVNLQYGKLGDLVAKELGYDLGERVRAGMLIEFVDPEYAGNVHWLWVLRAPVVQALEDLGWVRPTSHLLYPDSATVELANQQA